MKLPSTEFDAGYDQTFQTRDPDAPKRGKWVVGKDGTLIPFGEYRSPDPESAGLRILAGRFYENTCATDGTDIGSRKKHAEYMKRNGLAMASDYTEAWKKAAKEREAPLSTPQARKDRREAIERSIHQLNRKG